MILLMYGEDYVGAVAIFNILMIGSIFRYINVFYILFYNINSMHKRQQIINIVRAFSNILLDIVFIQFLGLKGPAIATSIVIIITTMYSVLYCEKRIRMQTDVSNLEN